MKIPTTRILALAAVAALGACDDSTGPDGAARLSLSVALAPSTQVAAAQTGAYPLARAETYDDGSNVLVLDRVALVLEEIELERLFDDDCDLIEGDDDACEEFEAGPFLLELPLDGSVDQVLAIDVPADTYDELEFELDRPDDDDQAERDFVLAHPEFDRVTIRVEGTWNGEPFVFTTDMEAEQELELNPPLVVAADSGPVNLTLSLDVSGWFRDGSGNLVDPRTANRDGENQSLVEGNIERSFDIFEDHDRDGDDDHHDDD
ncbi:MAG TPA: hypothetical protein VLA43_04380 [Longimicrobiales bacterium]|nr:hypothetical protein [Longimicrobiales bacterium]